MKKEISHATIKLAGGAVAIYLIGIWFEAYALLFVILTLLLVWMAINCLYPIKRYGINKRTHAFLGFLLIIGAMIYASTEPQGGGAANPPVVTKPAAGQIAYEEFHLEKHEMKYLPLLKEAATKIMAQASCEKIDFAARSVNKGTKANPVFYFTCVKNGIPTNIFLSVSEMKEGHISHMEPIDIAEGRQRCSNYAKAQLNFPSTFSSGIFSWGTMDWPNGRRRVVMDFTAKNAFGMKLPASINCLFIPKKGGGYEMEATIAK